MRNKILLILSVVVIQDGGQAFVPPHPRTFVKKDVLVRMAVETEPEKQKKKKVEWWADPLSAMQQWFETVTGSITPEKQQETDPKKVEWWADPLSAMQQWFETVTESITLEKQQEADWASEFNETGEEEVGDIVEQELPEAVVTEVEEKEEEVVVIVAETTEEEEETVAPRRLSPKNKLTSTNKLTEGKDEWITRDMEWAGLGQGESQDWVAEDLAKTGRTVGISKQGDWVAKDMAEAGTVASAKSFKTKDMRSKSKNVHIREDMEKAGHETGSEFVEEDMKRMGEYGSDPTYSVMDTLKQRLNKEHEKAYDDVYDDMEKAGKGGSESQDWIKADMERAGTAEREQENLTPLQKRDGAYDVGAWLKKTFKPEDLREAMEDAGQASSRDWVAEDMQETGRNYTSLAARAPKQDKDLAEHLDARGREGKIAHNMKVEGMAELSWTHLESNKNLEDMVAEDMKKVGSLQSSSWVERDMIEAGHALQQQGPTGPHISHKERETKEFMAMRKVKRGEPVVEEEKKTKKKEEEKEVKPNREERINAAAWRVVRPAKKAAAVTEGEEVEEEHHEVNHLRDTLVHAAKKIIHPLTKWEDL